uniref:Uncharacterized protein n=1 Tax=Anguilla anguilla TaxID=7936 RepID=A0A0E9QBZ6_ANGAN
MLVLQIYFSGRKKWTPAINILYLYFIVSSITQSKQTHPIHYYMLSFVCHVIPTITNSL